MTSTDPDQFAWQAQFSSQPHSRRSISPDDFTYALALLLLSSMRAIPASYRIAVIGGISSFLARLLCAANVRTARNIRENMELILGSDFPEDLTLISARRLLSMIVWNSLIIYSLPTLRRSQIANLVPTEGISCLDNCLEEGHPVLIWGYHFGVDPLIVATLLHARGYPVHAITHMHQTPDTASFLQRTYFHRLHPSSEDDQLSVIDPREGIQRKILDVLKSRQCLYITPDYMIPESETQVKSDFEVTVNFLNRKAYLHTGGLRLAKRLGAKVVTVLSTKDNRNQWRLVVEPFELPTNGFTPGELQHDLQMCMRRLEARVLAHPYLWLDLKRSDLAQRLRMPQANM